MYRLHDEVTFQANSVECQHSYGSILGARICWGQSVFQILAIVVSLSLWPLGSELFFLPLNIRARVDIFELVRHYTVTVLK